MADLLGVPYKRFQQLPEWSDKQRLFQVLKEADEADRLMCVSAPVGDAALQKEYEAVGLATNHSYSLLRVKQVQGHQLLMIRNPWGNDKEWNGAWSDDSTLWTPEIQNEVGFYKGDDGTFWMAWNDVIKYFDGGAIAEVERVWPQVRITGNFVDGVADLVLQLSVGKPLKLHYGCHQRDVRGLPSGDKDLKYVGVLLSVIRATKDGVEVVDQSMKGAYSEGRDVTSFVSLSPSPFPYFIHVQPFDPKTTKSFTLSLVLDDPHALTTVQFKTFGGENQKKRYSQMAQFRVDDWSTKATANFQVRTAKLSGEGMNLQTKTAECIDVKSLTGGDVKPKPPPKQQAVKVHVDPTAPPKPIAKPAPVPASNPAPVKPVTSSKTATAGKIKLQLIVLSGRNLVAKDSNGLSDPYVTVKLKTASGARLANDQRHESRYIKETLNPVWCEVFNFHVTADDVLCVKVWDKDTFGHDAMGVVNVAVAGLLASLSAGGPSKMEWFPLGPPPDDASGEIQLAFSWLL